MVRRQGTHLLPAFSLLPIIAGLPSGPRLLEAAATVTSFSYCFCFSFCFYPSPIAHPSYCIPSLRSYVTLTRSCATRSLLTTAH